MSGHASKSDRVPLPCKCGCGQEVIQKPGAGRPKLWIDEHKPKRVNLRSTLTELPLCECGCGLPVVIMGKRGSPPRFFPGHSPSAKARPWSVKVP